MLMVLGFPVAAFIVLEGGSSIALFAHQTASSQRPRLTEETSTEYDAELGWVGKKSFRSPDMFGPGVALHTNARGFRGAEEIDDAKPSGKQRLVCSGDSFTVGLGVSDDDTWCAGLATPELQTVNMGQGAYGIDQAYLWYKRDGRALAHDVQVLAFITDDFRRMSTDRFLTKAKPRLAIQGDSLVVLGVPVPLASRESWKARLVPAVQSLRMVQLVARLTSGDTPRTSRTKPGPSGKRTQSEDLSEIVARVIADLAQINAAKKSTLVLAYLPVDTDFQNEASAPWRQRMRVIADSLHVPLLDLIPAQRKLGRQEMQQLYIKKGNLSFAEVAGHFTVEGNHWAAAQIHEGLDSVLRAAPMVATTKR
ncbi:MAG: hypothetical protein ABI877_08315 [Gemmatimonadaceae bacterium]